MAVYRLSALYKKSVIERTYYSRDGRFIVREEGWRWGNFSGEFETRPDIDLTEDIEIMSEEGWEMEDLDDGCWLDWEFPDDMSDEEREQIQNAYDEEYNEGLEGLGWMQDEYECWLQAPLRLELEDGTVITGEDEQEDVLDTDDSVDEINERVVVHAPTAAWPFPTMRPVDGSEPNSSDSNK